MPKKPTAAEIQKWREMAAEGLTYQQIGQFTGWDHRTIRRYLESDLRTAESRSIRLELFKERLGTHWDRLIDGVYQSLSAIRAPDAADNAEQISSAGILTFDMQGATATRGNDWDISVRVKARDLREWEMLFHHMPRDPLWLAVKEWEDSIVAELLAKRQLYLASGNYLVDADGLHEYSSGMQMLLYRHSLSKALNESIGIPSALQFVEDESGIVRYGADALTLGPADKHSVHWTYDQGRELLGVSIEAQNVARQIEIAQAVTQRASRLTKDLTLMPYLQGVCSLCERVEL